MNTILLSILGVSLVSGVITALGAGGFERYLQYFCALLLTVVLLSPLMSLLDRDFSFPDLLGEMTESTEQQVPEMYLRAFEEEIETLAGKLLWEKLSLKEADCMVFATAEDQAGMPVLCKVTVKLKTLASVIKTASIRKLLQDECGCEIEIEEDVHI